jgi:hypothetical protein
MKKKLAFSLILLAFPLMVCADTIIFKDGMRLEVSEVWEKDGEIKCKIGGFVFGYPKAEVKRIEKGQIGRKEEPVGRKKEPVGRKEEPAPIQEVHEKVTAIPKKEPASLKKKAIQKKEGPAPKKEKAKKAVAPEYAKIPAFKVLINEDDNNPPAYIKRRRVLLVRKGLTKDQIRTLLLSYEKKLRNELKAQSAKYKLIVVWAYDDFYKADEGAGGWVGMISNDPKTGGLSDNPKLSIK